MMRTRTLSLCLLLTGLGASPAMAEDLGSRAQTYAPDPDARDELKVVVREKERTGELAAFWRSYRDTTINAIKHPASLGLPVSYTPRTVIQPVSFTVASAYRDVRGDVIAPAGMVIEPLRRLPLRYGLIFIDGTDQRQVDYALARGRATPLKIVLTAGSPFELRVKYQREAWGSGLGVPFYFDQRKLIITSLKRLYGIDIATVPVVMTQQGTGVKVEYGMGS